MTSTGEPLEIEVGERAGRVSALLLRPPEPWAGYVLAHGAGAGMTHPFMESVARALREGGVLDYEFRILLPDGRVRWIADQVLRFTSFAHGAHRRFPCAPGTPGEPASA